jgi:hypothetical protein
MNEDCNIELFCLFAGSTICLSLAAFGSLIFLCKFLEYSLGSFAAWPS